MNIIQNIIHESEHLEENENVGEASDAEIFVLLIAAVINSAIAKKTLFV